MSRRNSLHQVDSNGGSPSLGRVVDPYERTASIIRPDIQERMMMMPAQPGSPRSLHSASPMHHVGMQQQQHHGGFVNPLGPGVPVMHAPNSPGPRQGNNSSV